ncbi:MAG: hypothetical protein LKF15_00055 [Lachnospiraceae bacterium]|nr:hypothetical protein [Lachnospiraceae bacterium]MCH4027357.1 hypothetical protein [Lachnospiraceae bacterium]MCH4065197.1 hypothetical protein [Lachnospiraceae bacterium]MCH4111237.1 hypothetical protein [Lachnospiraceae bacterium]
MSLTFEKVITAPRSGTQNFLANQPDNSLYQHYVSEKYTPWQVHTQITLADYDTLSWSDPPEVCMTPREVRHIGVKTFPQLGAIGFYRLRYRDSSRIVVPLHPVKSGKRTAPELSVVLNKTTGSISYAITPAEDITYDCYRIEMECGNLSYSHVVYELSGEFTAPDKAGTFRCFVIGYLQEGQICSKDSSVTDLEIPATSASEKKKYTIEDIAELDNRISGLENGTSSASQKEIIYGTEAPSDSIGQDGQIYVQWEYAPEE